MTAYPSLHDVLGGHYTAALLEPIAEELLEQVDLLERAGATYALRYLRHVRTGGQGYPPRAPLGMNAHIAKAVRDVVQDHALNARFTMGRKS